MRYSVVLFFAFLSFGTAAQLNTALLGQLNLSTIHSTNCNDIWGYIDEAGNEYALVGTEDGVSVVDVTNPALPVELAWIPGMNSIWRDLKVYQDYAYITTEAEEGLLIIDLSPLPASTTLPFSHYSGPSGNPWLSAHNLYEDNGYLYICGANRGNGGVIILDVFTDPLNPVEVGVFDNWYAHDGFVQNDTGYFGHINEGFFSIVDLTNKTSPIFLGSSSTPSIFTHNVWTSVDGNYAFTTDEVSGGYLGAYDVSDPSNIKFLDKIQSSPGDNVMPHNTHVQGNYLMTSYYADGLVVHDITHPHNMIEVANYDTSPLSGAGSVGCWGAYPFLPSGNLLASDRGEGLFIIGANLHQGAYLEGNITELGSGIPLNNVDVTIDGQNIHDKSNVIGDYATGIESTGTYDITYSKVLYFPQTISKNLSEGSITSQDVALQKIPQYFVNVQVLDAVTLDPIENAEVVFTHTLVNHSGFTDVNGEISLGMYYQDNYDAVAGKWGFVSDCFEDTLINNSSGTITFYLNQGIYDDFSLDFGWSVFGDAAKGMWVREKPIGVSHNGLIENPFTDSDFDCGDICFITGNGATTSNTDEVGQGETNLFSPLFDLTGYTDPHVNFQAFYFNKFGAPNPDDTLFVRLFNGVETVTLANINRGNTPLSLWIPYSIPIGSQITLSSTMQLIVSISDYDATLNITEASFDNFSVTDFSLLKVENQDSQVKLYPNPFEDEVIIEGVEQGSVEIWDMSGKLIRIEKVGNKLNLGELESGFYIFVVIDESGKQVLVSKQIKK